MTIDVGILGAGNIADRRHIPAFKATGRARVVSVYDRDPDQALSVADAHGIDAVDSPGELYRSSDLVSVCTPPWKHRDHAIEAMQRGCHVLTEKPMGMTSAETREMVEVADKRDRVLSVVHNFLFMDAVSSARNLVDSGRVGAVNRTYNACWLNLDHLEERHGPEWFEMPGGVFWDEAPHLLYLTADFVGDLSLRRASADPREGLQPYEAVSATFDGSTGATGTVSVIYDSPTTEWWFVIVCERGLIFVDIFRNTTMWFGKESSRSPIRVFSVVASGIVQTLAGIATAGLSHLWNRATKGYQIPDGGFSHQVDSVLDAVETGSDPAVTGADGRSIVGAAEEIAEVTGMTNDTAG